MKPLKWFTARPIQFPADIQALAPAAQTTFVGTSGLYCQWPAQQVIGETIWFGDALPMATGGVLIPWPGLGYTFLFCRARIHPVYRRSLLYALRQSWQRIMAHAQCRRYETTVLATFIQAQRLTEWLGFVPECIKTQYGPQGEDMVSYVLLTEKGVPHG